MNKKLQKFTHVLPPAVRRRLLKLYQKILWSIYFKRYLKIVETNSFPNKKLIFAWGNPGWSAQQDYIETLIHYANYTNKLILECGSGLSTLLLGPIAKKRNIRMISFEHCNEWANKVQRELNKYKLINNEILIRSLVNYGDFDWYDTNNLDMHIPDIGLCVCDAPPGNTFGGRKGFLYLFKNKVKTGTVILVDDTIREAEQKMIKEWENILSFDIIQKGTNDPHAILTIQ